MNRKTINKYSHVVIVQKNFTCNKSESLLCTRLKFRTCLSTSEKEAEQQTKNPCATHTKIVKEKNTIISLYKTKQSSKERKSVYLNIKYNYIFLFKKTGLFLTAVIKTRLRVGMSHCIICCICSTSCQPLLQKISDLEV